MLPRNSKIWTSKINTSKIFFLIFFLLVSFFASSSSQADNVFIKFYQEHISVVDGNRCPMHPSCSAYASQAIEKHGLLLGWVMACDRLVRCGRDEVNISMKIIVNNQKLVNDPVDANDFWWFEKEKKE